jgi:ADP-ribose pyrophosphatase YjhB (NUDIX family)
MAQEGKQKVKTGYNREQCKLIERHPVIRVGTALYLADLQGNLLLARRWENGLWSLPGGSLQPGETLEDALRREVRKDLGLELNEIQMVHVFSGSRLYDVTPAGLPVYFISATFLPHNAKGIMRLDTLKFSEARYFATWNLPMGEIHPPDLPLLEHFMKRFPGGRPQSVEDFPWNHRQNFWEEPAQISYRG